MSLPELEVYTGSNPRPGDLDAYWTEALDELGEVDPKVTLERRESPAPYAEMFDLNFTGVRGARLHAQYLRPVGNSEPHPAVLMFHGYSGDSGDWTEWNKLGYVAQGFSVLALDTRGQAGLSEDVGGVAGYTVSGHLIRGLDGDPHDLLYRHIFLDCAQLARIAMGLDEVDASRVGTFGVSQGGGLAFACAALEPAISRVAPVIPFHCDYKHAWEMNLDGLASELAYMEIKAYFRRFDPLHERENEVFNRLGYIDLTNLADRIRGRVLLTTTLLDAVCPASGQFAVYNNVTAPKKILVYPDYQHEIPPGTHDAVFEFLTQL